MNLLKLVGAVLGLAALMAAAAGFVYMLGSLLAGDLYDVDYGDDGHPDTAYEPVDRAGGAR